jgi:hypothetical protein
MEVVAHVVTYLTIPVHIKKYIFFRGLAVA